MIKRHHHILPLLCFLGVSAGCANHLADREDDAAMLIYRDCMNGMPNQAGAFNHGAAIANSPSLSNNVPIQATAQTMSEQNQQIECMQKAGWKKQP